MMYERVVVASAAFKGRRGYSSSGLFDIEKVFRDFFAN